MGQPAARIGDTTVHGGTITVGCPTVLIGGMPAARMGDMHVCPMVTPAGPAPIPHVGGPVMKGSMGVLIGGMPAARMGDMALCTGPPDSIIAGCMTVLIGETGGGGAGGGGGGAPGAGQGAAAAGAIASASIAGSDPRSAERENHFLDVRFVDKGGKPVTGLRYSLKAPDNSAVAGVLGGRIKRTGVAEGAYEITLRAIVNAQWDRSEAEAGDTVTITVETVGVEADEQAIIQVFVRDSNYADHLLETFEAPVSGTRVEQQWTLEVDEKMLAMCDRKSSSGGYSNPFFFCMVRIGELAGRSGLLYYKDYAEIELKDDSGAAIADKKYTARLATGEVREGTVDGSGKAKLESIPPGTANVEFDLKS